LVTNDAVKERKNYSTINYSIDRKAEQSSTVSESLTSREEDLSIQNQDKRNKKTTLDLSNKEETLETNLSMIVVADSRIGASELVKPELPVYIEGISSFSDTIDKVQLASNLPISQSGHEFTLATSADSIMRLIEDSNLFGELNF